MNTVALAADTVANATPSTAAERAMHRWSHPRSPIFAADREVFDAFLAEQRSRGLAATTIRNRDSILRTFAASAGRPLLELNVADLRAYTGRDGISNATRNTIRAAMSAFYQFAVDEGHLSTNPVDRLGKARTVRGTPRPFTAAQVDRMLTSGAYRRTRAMILLGYYQGFRVSMIARVHGHDLDVESGRINTVGKGNKERTLPLHPTIAALAESMPEDGYWFPARGGREGHITGHAVSDVIGDAIRRAGIHDPKLTPHSLRHSFGTDLVEAGVDIRVIQELMMHESLATTQVYAGVSERIMREGINKLETHDTPTRSGRARRGAVREGS